MNTVKIKKSSSPMTTVKVKYCDTFISKFLGLMFSQELKPENGIIIVEKNETRINTAIHMMFVNFDLTVLWLDKSLVIVDKVLAKRWVPFYASKKSAQYVVELHRSKFSEFSIGDQLILSNEE